MGGKHQRLGDEGGGEEGGLATGTRARVGRGGAIWHHLPPSYHCDIHPDQRDQTVAFSHVRAIVVAGQHSVALITESGPLHDVGLHDSHLIEM